VRARAGSRGDADKTVGGAIAVDVRGAADRIRAMPASSKQPTKTPAVAARRGRPPKVPVVARTAPGRPEGNQHNIRERILDGAEVEFAALGYAGTTLREVANRAKVTQALISYYFDNKHKLFEEVFLRRGRKVSDDRLNRLEALRMAGGAASVEDIVHAFLQPTLALRGTPGGRAFIRLQARLHTEPPEISYRLRNEAYDVSTRAFVDALCIALPKLPRADVYWRVTLMVGAYLYAFSDTHRLEELAKGICHPGDAQETMRQISAFVTGGLVAPAAQVSVRLPVSKRKRSG
jgi:AcrR family transcriptional regulator